MNTNQNETKPFSGDTGIYKKITENISQLLESATTLQDALIHRRVDDIWNILADKQEKSSHLEQYTQLWNELYTSDNPTTQSPAFTIAQEQIRTALAQLRLAERNNASLSQSFLGAIRKAFSETGTGFANKKKTYNRYGRMGAKHSSLLVNRLG